jgi:hypothetical protein
MDEVAGRSFYTPFWAGIENNWYKNSAIDAVWKPSYDNLVEELVKNRPPYIYPFAREILRVVDEENGTSFYKENANHDYYILNRAFQMPQTRSIWLDSIEREIAHVHICPICNKQNHVLHFHPDLIRQYGTNPPWCRDCNYLVRRYSKAWNEDTKERLKNLMSHVKEPRACDICTKTFSLEKDVFTYRTFNIKLVDVLYPNLFASICPTCFEKAFKDNKKGSRTTHLHHLYDLFLLIGKIPTQDFDSLFYLFTKQEPIVQFITLLQKMRTPAGYAEEFGSFFAALVESGVLPKGSKKMTIGTMVLAKDGHVCLSLVEKEIDDFLFENGINHEKEVYYPNSNYRTDWELFGTDSRTFVEYFGLMSNSDYATKTSLKQAIAVESKINLISLFPETSWKDVLLNWKTQLNK